MHWLLGTRLWFNAKYIPICLIQRDILMDDISRVERSATPFGSRHKHTNSSSAREPPRKELAVETDADASPILESSSELRCSRCHGRRSPSYHRRHQYDPGISPAIGICTRRRTGCAAAKRKLRAAATLPAIPELAAGEDL